MKPAQLIMMVGFASTFGAALADAPCPADRPNSRIVGIGAVTCTAVMCLQKLHCPPDGGECRYVATNDCNKCTQEKRTICLSDDELRQSHGAGTVPFLPNQP